LERRHGGGWWIRSTIDDEGKTENDNEQKNADEERDESGHFLKKFIFIWETNYNRQMSWIVVKNPWMIYLILPYCPYAGLTSSILEQQWIKLSIFEFLRRHLYPMFSVGQQKKVRHHLFFRDLVMQEHISITSSRLSHFASYTVEDPSLYLFIDWNPWTHEFEYISIVSP